MCNYSLGYLISNRVWLNCVYARELIFTEPEIFATPLLHTDKSFDVIMPVALLVTCLLLTFRLTPSIAVIFSEHLKSFIEIYIVLQQLLNILFFYRGLGLVQT